MKITVMAAAAAALVLTSFVAAAPAEAQPMRERTVVKTTTSVVHRDNGRHMGWRNKHRTRVCRTTWRHHQRHRICTVRVRR